MGLPWCSESKSIENGDGAHIIICVLKLNEKYRNATLLPP